MKAKLLLAALALPFVFTACSQDELENNLNNETIPSNAIKGMKLNIQKSNEGDGIDTRGTWLDNGNKIKFDGTDKISLYWLGEEDASDASYKTAAARASITGKFNSIFRTDNGDVFSSESLVFEGGNVAVYPGDVTFVKEGVVYLTVSGEQDEKVLNNVPYISNQLWIEKQGNDQTGQLPGYYGEKELDCPVKQAANVVNLTLSLSNIPAGYDFEVQSVELETKTDEKVFATKSQITTIAEKPNYKGEVVGTANPESKVETIVAQTWSGPVDDARVNKLISNNITKENDNTVVAHFVVLPTDAQVVTASDANIIVRTNCGTITLNAAEKKEGKDAENKYILEDPKGNKVSIDVAIKSFVQSETAGEDSKFKGEKIGKTFRRSIDVDVREAKLNGSLVYTSDDILRYVDLHNKLTSTEKVNLVMAVKQEAEGVFKSLTKAAVEAVNGKNGTTQVFTLGKGTGLTEIEIVGGGDVFDVPALANDANVLLSLSNEEWAMDDKMEIDEGFSGIYNNGTLTIRGTLTSGNQNTIQEAITNNGTIKLGGNNLVKVGTEDFKTLADSEISIGAEQELQFTSANSEGDLAGTINVDATSAKLTATAAINNGGEINNKGIVAGTTTDGWINKGKINVKDGNAITYLKDNTNGTIVLMTREDEVKVDAEEKKGKIVYNWNDGAEFSQTAADKFTYVIFNGMGKLTIKTSTGTLEKKTSMEFKGICTLTANNVTIKDLIIESGADFRFTSGNLLKVTNLTNKGLITIGGNIEYSGEYTENGRVLTTGEGAITEKEGV